MSKAALVRGAFAIQCTFSVPPVISAVSRCSHACSHYQSPIVKYGTVDRSDLAKCRQDDLCCRRTIRRWNPEARGFRLVYGTPAADEKNFIHTPVSAKSSVPLIREQIRRADDQVSYHTVLSDLWFLHISSAFAFRQVCMSDRQSLHFSTCAGRMQDTLIGS